jgi:hypothetical protein
LPVDIDSWLDALDARHTRDMRRQDLLKAIRALSARYVERRSEIGRRSPIDSPGKRAAFAVFFAPLHFLIAREIVRALGDRATSVDQLVDLGCGTGVVSAAWSLERDRVQSILGIDRDRWSLSEADWNWRRMNVRGRVRQGDLVRLAIHFARPASAGDVSRALVAGWSVNELTADARAELLSALMRLSATGTAVLLIEPIARRAVPWWPEWVSAFARAGGRADEWRFDVALPDRLAEFSEAAGFRREALTARSLWLHPEP